MELHLVSAKYVVERAVGRALLIPPEGAADLTLRSVDVQVFEFSVEVDRALLSGHCKSGRFWILLTSLLLRNKKTGDYRQHPVFSLGVVAIPGPSETSNEIEVRLPDSLGGRIQVLDSRGNPMAGRSLSLIPPAATRMTFDIETDEEGTFPVPGDLEQSDLVVHDQTPDDSGWHTHLIADN